MPARVVCDSLWRSKKLKDVPVEYRAEYANLLPLASANGSFEWDPDSIWADVYSYNRPEVTPDRVVEILASFVNANMLEVYEQGGRQYGTFVGINKPGRLPSPAHQGRYKDLPPAPTPVVQKMDEPRRSNRPIESEVELLCRGSLGYVEDRKLWNKDLRDAVRRLGHDEVLASFEVWLESQINFTGKRPVSTFLKTVDNLAQPVRVASAGVTSGALQQVEDTIALLSSNDVVFSNQQKPLLAIMVRDHGAEPVEAAFRDFWGKVDDFSRKFAARDFLEKGPQFLRTLALQKQKREDQEQKMAAQRDVLQQQGAAELAAVEDAQAAEAALENEAFAGFAEDGPDVA